MASLGGQAIADTIALVETGIAVLTPIALGGKNGTSRQEGASAADLADWIAALAFGQKTLLTMEPGTLSSAAIDLEKVLAESDVHTDKSDQTVQAAKRGSLSTRAMERFRVSDGKLKSVLATITEDAKPPDTPDPAVQALSARIERAMTVPLCR